LNPSDFIDRVAIETGQRAGALVRQYPKRVYAAVVLALVGFGATAFGVAPLTNNDPIPQQWVTASVVPTGLGEQVAALSNVELPLFRNDVTRRGDTADSLLRRLNVTDVQASNFLRSSAAAKEIFAGNVPKMIQVRTDAFGAMAELTARYPAMAPEQLTTHFTRLRVTKQNGQFVAAVETVPLTAQSRMGSGVVRNSFFTATDDAGIPDSVAAQLPEIFSTEVNFHRQLRRGDTFSILYEVLTADGEPLTWNESAGRVLAAEFVNKGKSHSAVWFGNSDGGGGAYFDLSGQSKQRSFLASPLEFSRITSGFAMRIHPISQMWRQHAGIDYAAPIGTPVRTVSDGVVEFDGVQKGYGNVVVVKHSAERSTLYAHLSRIDVKPGQSVTQGMTIGAVGATGWATGPHLHFEFKVAGVQRDPIEIAGLVGTGELAGAHRSKFSQFAKSVKAQLNVADAINQSRTHFE
jgi:murein DD-endopeptidase MepM/ murein hydrolase activator NlpD